MSASQSEFETKHLEQTKMQQTETIITRLSEIVGADLPTDYLHLMENYPEQFFRLRRAIDDSMDEGVVAEVDLQSDWDCVLELNIEVRAEPLTNPDGVDELWPDQFLVIGESGAGDYYCIDAQQDIPGVIQYDHHAVCFEQVADSLAEFTEILEETFGDEQETVS